MQQASQPTPQPTYTETLLNLLITLLTPMFVLASNGDIQHARLAAAHTLNEYRAQTHADLLSVAQIIAFGLAALGSLSLSMTGTLSVSMTLRLRANAAACSRAAEQHQRTRAKSTPAAAPDPVPDTIPDRINEADLIASVAAIQQRTSEAEKRIADVHQQTHHAHREAAPPDSPAAAPQQQTQPRDTHPQAAPGPAQPHQPAAQAKLTPSAEAADRHQQTLWAAAFARIAAERTQDLPNLSPAERRTAKLRAAMLTSCATNLLDGPTIQQIQPGDLPTLLQAASVPAQNSVNVSWRSSERSAR